MALLLTLALGRNVVDVTLFIETFVFVGDTGSSRDFIPGALEGLAGREVDAYTELAFDL